MRPFDAAELYSYSVRALAALTQGTDWETTKPILDEARLLLRHLAFQAQPKKDLPNAVKAATALADFIEGSLLPVRGTLNETYIRLLREYLQGFETALKLDLGRLPIYLLEDKRGYSARQFLSGSGARELFSSRDQASLSPFCLADIDQA